jgi:regulator of sigma E protease
LAILNLIPLPILDGGQILFYTIEAIIGRSIPDKIREYIFIGTWLGFMLLTIYLVGQDIMRIAGHYIEPALKWIGFKK